MLSVQRDKEKHRRVVGFQLQLKSSVLAVGRSSPPRENSQLLSPSQLEQPDDYNVLFVWWAQRPHRGCNTPSQLRLRRLVAIVLVVGFVHSINGSTSLSLRRQPTATSEPVSIYTSDDSSYDDSPSVVCKEREAIIRRECNHDANRATAGRTTPGNDDQQSTASSLSLSFSLKAANCNLRNVPPQPKTSVEEPQRPLDTLKSVVC